ncbi:MAG: 16S rRNA (cytidine(1402)-2'-O)-methyltransferase [Anaerolineaceae bacterium]|nr:16S rRNA (cytidine(1402)-2'-O)-methyltransferase [Anaerolineaceae bacterium]
MLYLVSTPIGNLGDISFRAIEVLKSVDLIASEDTRKTSILLKHFEISKPQVVFNKINEEKAVPKLLEKLKSGVQIALVTSAGTPAISDPGYSLAKAAIEAGLQVSATPGPSAVIMALTLSGLPLHSFTFRGFAPNKEGPRRSFLMLDQEAPHTLVFYESPFRLLDFLKTAQSVYGDRRAVVANDLTKKFEKVMRGTLSELQEQLKAERIQGEYVVCIEGYQAPKAKAARNKYPKIKASEGSDH